MRGSIDRATRPGWTQHLQEVACAVLAQLGIAVAADGRADEGQQLVGAAVLQDAGGAAVSGLRHHLHREEPDLESQTSLNS